MQWRRRLQRSGPRPRTDAISSGALLLPILLRGAERARLGDDQVSDSPAHEEPRSSPGPSLRAVRLLVSDSIHHVRLRHVLSVHADLESLSAWLPVNRHQLHQVHADGPALFWLPLDWLSPVAVRIPQIPE